MFSLTGAVSREVGIDFGTANTVIFMKDKGIVLREPSVIAVDRRSEEVLAVGKEARDMLGKASGNIQVIRPIQHGVVADFDGATAMLRGFLKKAVKSGTVNRPKVIMGLPAGATEVERTAAEDVAQHAGGGDVSLMEAPLATLLGVGLSPLSPKGVMTVNFGAGLLQVAVAALGETIAHTTERLGGNRMDEEIIRFIKKKYHLQIGELTAEEVKLKIGSAFPVEDSFSAFMEVRGRSVSDNLPKNITVHADEIRGALGETLELIIRAIVRTTEALPPEIAADLLESGIVLTGGGAQLTGIGSYINEATGLKVRIAERPVDAVAEGLGAGLQIPGRKAPQ